MAEGDKWQLDEGFVKINGQTRYLGRAVDQDGIVLDILARTRRDTAAARRFFRKLLQRFLSAHGSIVSHLRPGRHRLRAPEYGQEMTQRFPTWRVATGLAASGACGTDLPPPAGRARAHHSKFS